MKSFLNWEGRLEAQAKRNRSDEGHGELQVATMD